jgi:hypothetical protein
VAARTTSFEQRRLRVRRDGAEGETEDDRRRGEQKRTASKVPAQSHETQNLMGADRAVNRAGYRIMSARALRIDVLGTPNKPP